MTRFLDFNGTMGHFFESFSLFSSFVIFGTATLLSLAVYVLYQLYFHPLAKYPGPFLGRLTRWYDVYHSYIGDKHVLLYHLHEKYGPIVRFTPTYLSINDPAALKDMYGHGANARKSVFYETFRARPDAISTLLTTNVKDHARKRRVLAHAFSDTAMRGMEQYVLANIDELVERLRTAITLPDAEKASWSKPVDMSAWCAWLVFDIMGDLVFGRSFETLGRKPENREAIRVLGRAARRNYTCAAMPGLASTGVERYLPWLRSLYVDRCAYLAFGMRQVQERMRDGGFSMASDKGSVNTGRKDMFTLLLQARDPETGEGFPMSELWMEGNTLIVAGSESTSTALATTLHYLTHHPNALARVTREVRAAFATRDDIRMGSTMHSLTFLRACIDESMRLTPSIGGLLPREAQAGGLALPSLGLVVPAGMTVGSCCYSVHHHAGYVKDPFAFRPERWLENEGGFAGQDPDALHAVFSPFSIGRHACLGKPLVYMELSLALARLVWEFDWRAAADQRPSAFVRRDIRAGLRRESEYHLRDWFMSKNEGPWVEIRPREEW